MNKNEFLEELNRHLLVLEDEEQQDILEEYSQHIDMKVESGLSEEEAIRSWLPRFWKPTTSRRNFPVARQKEAASRL